MASRSSCLINVASLVLFKKDVKKETLVLHFEMDVTEMWWFLEEGLAGKGMVLREEWGWQSLRRWWLVVVVVMVVEGLDKAIEKGSCFVCVFVLTITNLSSHVICAWEMMEIVRFYLDTKHNHLSHLKLLDFLRYFTLNCTNELRKKILNRCWECWKNVVCKVGFCKLWT